MEGLFSNFEKKKPVTENLDVTSLLQVNEFDDLNSYLLSKGREIIEIDGTNNINLGRIYSEVNHKLAGNNKYNGYWIKWLEALGQNRMTAKRYIDRYKLHEMAPDDNTKLLIKVCSHENISTLLNMEDPKGFLSSVGGVTLKEFKVRLKQLTYIEEPNDPNKVPDTFIDKYKSFTKKIKRMDLTKLNKDEFEEIQKLIEKFNKIID